MIRIISPDERLVYRYGDSEFYYRRISAAEYRMLERRNMVRGLIDFDSVGYEVIKKCLIGWKNVQDADGKEIEYSPELVEQIPITVLEVLFYQIKGSTGIDEALEKN